MILLKLCFFDINCLFDDWLREFPLIAPCESSLFNCITLANMSLLNCDRSLSTCWIQNFFMSWDLANC